LPFSRELDAFPAEVFDPANRANSLIQVFEPKMPAASSATPKSASSASQISAAMPIDDRLSPVYGAANGASPCAGLRARGHRLGLVVERGDDLVGVLFRAVKSQAADREIDDFMTVPRSRPG
jgi:hypothetical protein